MPRTVTQIQFPTPIPKARRVAAYARVSSDKDTMLHSLAAQVDYYSTYIRHHPGWAYVGVYADEAKTGTRDKIHFPLFPQHRDSSGNHPGTERPGHQRIF